VFIVDSNQPDAASSPLSAIPLAITDESPPKIRRDPDWKYHALGTHGEEDGKIMHEHGLAFMEEPTAFAC
jgi:hypothetical protein